MKNKSLVLALLVIVVMGAGGYGLYRLGMNHAMQVNNTASNAAPSCWRPSLFSDHYLRR